MFSYTTTIYESSGNTTVSIDGLSETYKIDESLDSAVLTIPRSTRKANFSRLSPVKIEIVDGATTYTRWWIVYSSKSEIESFGPTSRYTHTLALIEPTKMLEKYICGTLTFTQPLGGTQYTLKEVVDRILLLTPLKTYTSTSSTRVCVLDSTLGTYLDTLTSPQFYLDKKNLREALIEVFKYVNAIPRLTFNGTTWTLTADFINARNIGITVSTGLLDYMNEASSEDFSQKAEVFHENTIPTEDETIPNVYANSITNMITFRDETNLILGEDNFQLILPHKVYKLVSIRCLYSDGQPFDLDITDYVPEKKVYDTLLFQNSATNYRGSKRCSAYWTYGSNIISGFDTAFGAFGADLPIENIIDDTVLLQYSTSTSVDYTTDEKYRISFLVEYIPYIETDRSEQYREDISDFDLPSTYKNEETAIIVNARERINSLYRMTKNVYGQIQRLGVNTISFSLKHKTLVAYNGSNSGVYSQGDYTSDGYFVTTVELIYYTTYVIARYEMSKNFNRIAQFMNIDKEFRPYEITLTKSDYTLKRDIIIKLFYIEVSSGLSGSHVSSDLVTNFMNTFKTTSAELPISGVTLKAGTSSGNYGDEGVYMPLIATAEKNTIKWKLDFTDTKLAGKSVLKDSNLTQEQVIYTKDDGTIDFLQLKLYKNYWVFLPIVAATPDRYYEVLNIIGNLFPYVDTTKNIATDKLSTTNDIFIEAIIYDTTGDFPTTGIENGYYLELEYAQVYQYTTALGYIFFANGVAYKNDYVYYLPEYRIKKDRSEFLGVAMTLPILPTSSEVNKFIVGDMLPKDNVLIKPRTAKQLYFQVSTTRYTKANTENTGSTTAFASMSNAYITNNYIDIPSSVYAYDSYAITDVDGNLYVAVNQRGFDGTKTNITRIDFNFIRERG